MPSIDDLAPAAAPAPKGAFKVQRGPRPGARKVLIYGTGGIGKTSLASLAPNPVFLDLEGGTANYDVARIDPGGAWTRDLLMQVLASDALDGFSTVVIDTATKLEELCAADVVAKAGNLEPGAGLEGFGFGKGYKFLFESFIGVVAALDRHARAGRNVVWLAHDSTTRAVNPYSDDYYRFEPRLFTPSNGKDSSSIRYRLKEEVEEVWFLGYAVTVKDDKAKGGGVRMIHTSEQPGHIAKSRTLRGSFPFREGDGSIWAKLMATNEPPKAQPSTSKEVGT